MQLKEEIQVSQEPALSFVIVIFFSQTKLRAFLENSPLKGEWCYIIDIDTPNLHQQILSHRHLTKLGLTRLFYSKLAFVLLLGRLCWSLEQQLLCKTIGEPTKSDLILWCRENVAQKFYLFYISCSRIPEGSYLTYSWFCVSKIIDLKQVLKRDDVNICSKWLRYWLVYYSIQVCLICCLNSLKLFFGCFLCRRWKRRCPHSWRGFRFTFGRRLAAYCNVQTMRYAHFFSVGWFSVVLPSFHWGATLFESRSHVIVKITLLGLYLGGCSGVRVMGSSADGDNEYYWYYFER